MDLVDLIAGIGVVAVLVAVAGGLVAYIAHRVRSARRTDASDRDAGETRYRGARDRRAAGDRRPEGSR